MLALWFGTGLLGQAGTASTASIVTAFRPVRSGFGATINRMTPIATPVRRGASRSVVRRAKGKR